MPEDDAVPPAARLVRDFVNTAEPQTGEETLTGPDELHAFFTRHGLLAAGERLRAGDVAVALTVREGLRAVLLDHAGHGSDPEAVARLNEALAGAPVRLTVGGDGPRLVPSGATALARALAGLVEAIRQCTEEHAWSRLKVCARDTCRWAFYDASRNQNRRWCSMAGCGNHVKMRRAYAVRTGRRPAPATGTGRRADA